MTPVFPLVQQAGQGSAPQRQIAQFRSDGITAQTGLRIPFFSDDFARAYGLPRARLLNMISEATPLREERPYVPLVGLREIRYSRPGLVLYGNGANGPSRGMWGRIPVPGVTDYADLYWVSGTTLYRNGGVIATIPGTDMVRAAWSSSQIVFVAGGQAWWIPTVGGTFAPIAGLPPVLDVAFLGSYFIFACAGSTQFYFSAVNDASTIPGLNFESAELSADYIVALGVLNDELVVFKSRTVEFFSLSTDQTAPFAPIEGRGFNRGCASRDAVCFADNALFWIGDNRVVYRVAGTPGRVSSNAIEDSLRQCADIGAATAFVATFEGHELYVMNVPGVGSYAYDISRIGTTVSTYGDSYARGEWDEWASYGRVGFQGNSSASVAGTVYVGDDTSNAIWTQQVGAYSDGPNPLVREASAFIKIEEGRPRCDSLVLHCVMGVGNPTGAAMAPQVEMRFSDNGGLTFGKWRAAPLGTEGISHPRAEWRRLGLMRAPGRLVEVRCSDPVNFAISHLELNAERPAQ